LSNLLIISTEVELFDCPSLALSDTIFNPSITDDVGDKSHLLI